MVVGFRLQDDADQRPFVSRVINKLANYNGGLIQNTEQEPVDEPGEANDATSATPGGKKKKKKKAPSKKVLPSVVLFQHTTYNSGILVSK